MEISVHRRPSAHARRDTWLQRHGVVVRNVKWRALYTSALGASIPVRSYMYLGFEKFKMPHSACVGVHRFSQCHVHDIMSLS